MRAGIRRTQGPGTMKGVGSDACVWIGKVDDECSLLPVGMVAEAGSPPAPSNKHVRATRSPRVLFPN